jgi:serine/threonine-protein kinase/endoribonuclease IRE1
VLPGRIDHLPNLDAAFVGLVEETGSLYTMTPDHFPLVIFGDTPSDQEGARLIEGPPGADTDNESPSDARIQTPSAPVTCHNGSPHRQCLTGVRRLGEDSRSRISRLLDGTPSVGLPPDQNLNNFSFVKDDSTTRSWSNSSIFRPWLQGNNGSSVLGRNLPLKSPDSFLSTGSLTILSLFLVIIVLVAAKIKPRNTEHARTTIDPGTTDDAPLLLPPKEPILQSGGTPVTSLPASVVSPSSTPPLREDGDLAIPSLTSNNHADTAEDVNDGEESEKDGDAVTTGKRKSRRGKRGRKRKTVALPEGADDENENENGVNNPGHDDKGVTPPEPDTPHAIDTPAPSSPPAEPSLIVSDTVLGKTTSAHASIDQ